MKNFINSLTKEQVLKDELPLKQLLKNSLYYPACGFDGGAIRYCILEGRWLGINSFVYADYKVEKDQLRRKFEWPEGYQIFATKRVPMKTFVDDVSELNPLNWLEVDDSEKEKYHIENDNNKFPFFCQWYILERKEGYGRKYGPKRISLLYLCAEGVAIYKHLYNKFKIAPKVFVALNQGGYGGNWTDFRLGYQAMWRIVHENSKGLPDYFFTEELFEWLGYENIANIYYNGGIWGEQTVCIFKRYDVPIDERVFQYCI